MSQASDILTTLDLSQSSSLFFSSSLFLGLKTSHLLLHHKIHKEVGIVEAVEVECVVVVVEVHLKVSNITLGFSIFSRPGQYVKRMP